MRRVGACERDVTTESATAFLGDVRWCMCLGGQRESGQVPSWCVSHDDRNIHVVMSMHACYNVECVCVVQRDQWMWNHQTHIFRTLRFCQCAVDNMTASLSLFWLEFPHACLSVLWSRAWSRCCGRGVVVAFVVTFRTCGLSHRRANVRSPLLMGAPRFRSIYFLTRRASVACVPVFDLGNQVQLFVSPYCASQLFVPQCCAS
jgi:hypothetical protein